MIPVHFSRNAGGSVAGRAVLGAQDTPILDGPDPEAVLARVSELLAISPAVLADRRNAELQKAELLDRLESAFSGPNRAL